MRILVCGGRNYGDVLHTGGDLLVWIQRQSEFAKFLWEMEKIVVDRSSFFDPDDNWLPLDIEIIHGGATGADWCAGKWAVVNWCQVYEYKADWNKYKRAAGMIRNRHMLVESKPDLVVAFPGGKGTANMVSIAKKAGVEVIEVE